MIPCKRPSVTVDERAEGSGTYDVNCHVSGCGFTYPSDKQFVALKMDANDHARMHRAAHRDAVPTTQIVGSASEGFIAQCACGWGQDRRGTRTDSDAAVTYHLSHDHGLVT